MTRFFSDRIGYYTVENNGHMSEGNEFAKMFHRLETTSGEYEPHAGPYDYGIGVRIAKRVGGNWRVVKQSRPSSKELKVIH